MSDEVKAILKGAAVAAAGAILTYATQYVSGADFGVYQPIAVAVLSIAANALRKYSNAF